MDEVAARRQALNEEAYKSVLQTLFARSKTDAKFMLLMQKLRKELNITPEQHKAWLQQLQSAKQSGSLNVMLGEGLHSAGQGHGARAGNHVPGAGPTAMNKARSNGPAKRRRQVVMDEEELSDHTVSAGGDSYGSLHQVGMQHQQGWRGASSADTPAYHHPGAAYGYGQGPPAGQPHAGYGHPAAGSAAVTKSKAAPQQQQPPQDVPPLIGFRVQRYWPSEGKWFDGVITDRRTRDGHYCITYNIGRKDESMEWFDIEAAAAIGNPQISHYQLTPEQLDMRKYTHTRAYQSSSVLNVGRSKKGSGGGGGGGGSGKPSHKKRHTGDMM